MTCRYTYSIDIFFSEDPDKPSFANRWIKNVDELGQVAERCKTLVSSLQ